MGDERAHKKCTICLSYLGDSTERHPEVVGVPLTVPFVVLLVLLVKDR